MFNLKKVNTMKIKLNIIKGLGILLMVIAGLNVNGQQDPMYTQYMFNTQTINPAYAGTWESLSFMVLARQQWAGLSGAPKTYTISMQAPLKNERVALGLNVINDKVGLERRFYMFADYSYLVPLNETVNLRMGLKGGFTNYSNNLGEYNTNPEGSGIVDPAFQGEIDRKFMPNFGVGAFAFSDRFYVGFSVPKILNNEFDDNINNLSVSSEFRHYFLMAGMVFNIGEDLKFKPTMLTKASFTSETGGPVQFDIAGNFLIKERFWLGANYRPGSAFGFIAQWIIDNKMRIGYAFDYSTTNINNFENGTHEIMISYELKFLNKRFISPRYF
jgi:type IX secretion system PorP/SprF family membrane protein